MKHFQIFSVRVTIKSRCYNSIFPLYSMSMGKVYENTLTGQSAWFAFGVFNTRQHKRMRRETASLHRPKSIANSESITEASKRIRSNWFYSICFNIMISRHRNPWNNEAWTAITAITVHSKQQLTPNQTTNQKIAAATLLCGAETFTQQNIQVALFLSLISPINQFHLSVACLEIRHMMRLVPQLPETTRVTIQPPTHYNIRS